MGMYISAGRSYLFNLMLAQRVMQHNWNHFIDGDIAILDGSRSFFKVSNAEENLDSRLAEFDIHPALPLYGSGDWPSDGEAKCIELAVIEQNPEIANALVAVKAEVMPRATRLKVSQLRWQFSDKQLILEFTLPAGSFATTLLSQLLKVDDAQTFN